MEEVTIRFCFFREQNVVFRNTGTFLLGFFLYIVIGASCGIILITWFLMWSGGPETLGSKPVSFILFFISSSKFYLKTLYS